MQRSLGRFFPPGRQSSGPSLAPVPVHHRFGALTLLPDISFDDARALLRDDNAPGGDDLVTPADVPRADPAATIVIVTHNNLVLTRLCLESIFANTDGLSYEVIVVDNGSTDRTPEFLRRASMRTPGIRALFNAANEGFARANNQGLALARGRYLVLLNNDTVVPPGWLPSLVAHLEEPGVGMVGPVTNATGNEACVEVPYRTWAEMEAFAAARQRDYDGREADLPMLAMFCVAMRRQTFDAIGPLDERFGVGLFEDDDYAHRMRLAGYRVVCAGDAFVHHVGEAAFKTLIDRGDYGELFDANRRAYEAKWQVEWTRHVRRPLVLRGRDERPSNENR